MMSGVEGVVSRIAAETQEIKELEQQLTEGHILLNEAVHTQLHRLSTSLQLTIRQLRLQVRGAQQKVNSLRSENRRLRLHLTHTHAHCKQLEDAAAAQAQEMCVQQNEVSMLRMEAAALRDGQVESSKREAELEAELRRLRAELALAQSERRAAERHTQAMGITVALNQDLAHNRDRDRDLDLDLVLDRDRDREQPRSPQRVSIPHKLGAELLQVQRQRDDLLLQLRAQSHAHRRSLSRLHRKLRALGGSLTDSQQLTAQQLSSTAAQLRDINRMLELLLAHTQQAASGDSSLELHFLGSPEGGGSGPHVPPTGPASDTGAEWRDSGGGSDADDSSTLATPRLPAPAPPPRPGAQRPAPPPAPPSRAAAKRECVQKEAWRLKEETKKLQLESKSLQHKLERHRSVIEVCEEVACVEKTLLKRRAELRQADRLLLEAHSCVRTARDKVQQQEALWAHTRRAVGHEKQNLAAVQSQLLTHRGELKEVLEELLREQLSLQEVKRKHPAALRRSHSKQEEVNRKKAEPALRQRGGVTPQRHKTTNRSQDDG